MMVFGFFVSSGPGKPAVIAGISLCQKIMKEVVWNSVSDPRRTLAL